MWGEGCQCNGCARCHAKAAYSVAGFGAFADSSSDPSLDVNTIVSQMDQTVWALKSTWEQLDSKWVVMFTNQQAQATDARLASLRALIADLDVGGVARQHVFFPLEGQTSDQAWATYKDTANYVRQGLADLGGFISTWSLAPTLARIGTQAKNYVSDVGTGALVAGVGLLAALILLKR